VKREKGMKKEKEMKMISEKNKKGRENE